MTSPDTHSPEQTAPAPIAHDEVRRIVHEPEVLTQLLPDAAPVPVVLSQSVEDARLVVFDAAGHGVAMGPSVDALIEAVRDDERARIERLLSLSRQRAAEVRGEEE